MAAEINETETINYLNDDFSDIEKELEKISEQELIKIEVNQGLEESLKELELLKNEISQQHTANLLELCKDNVIETITSQFGLASLFIDTKDGGNVTTAHNFEKGIVANDADKQKYDDWQAMKNKNWDDVRKETGYDKPLPKMRKEAFKTQEVIIDEYTGRPLPKDGRAQLDHIVSASEIENNAKANLFQTPEERAKMATDKRNLAWTEGSANQSKGKNSMTDWLEKTDKKTGKSNAERFGIDEKKAMTKDREARKFVTKTINKDQFKKYSKEVLTTGTKDAAKMAAYTGLGIIMRDLCQGIMIEVRITFEQKGKETFKEIFARFKSRLQQILSDLKHKFKDIISGMFESGIMAFLSNIVVFVINLFATTLKKIVGMIRAGFVSLCQAVKMLVHPPIGMSREEANFQALKILTAGIIGAASLGLSAGIEKLLQSIPGLQPLMMFPIPSFGKEQRTVSDVLAVTFSALIGGLLTTIVLYFLDKCKNNAKHDKLQIQLMTQSGVVVNYQITKSWFTLDEGYRFLAFKTEELYQTFANAEQELNESSEKVDQEFASLNNSMEKLRAKLSNR